MVCHSPSPLSLLPSSLCSGRDIHEYVLSSLLLFASVQYSLEIPSQTKSIIDSALELEKMNVVWENTTNYGNCFSFSS